ncbi:MAG TPA: translocation/assembly module TamB domain-containing protein [Pyrinomonadaceae bacterium]|nr:translocation/assembly module TamB domain-containing protein [Pyrinomonadaceae bacterium]
MPVDNHRDSPGENNRKTSQPTPPTRARRRFVTRRNTILVVIGLVCAVAALILVSLIAYRLGFVDRYIAGQVKDTLANYGVRAEIRSFHTSISPQSVELQGVELYDAKTGEKIGKIDRMLVTVRVEDLFALRLQRNINLKDLKLEGLELWVNFDAEGRSNFRNIHIPPPEPNARILFAYSTAHVEIKNSQIHYGDVLHSLSGEARNMHLIVQPDDLNAPAASWMNQVTFTSSNSTFTYDGRAVNNIDIDARARVNQTRAEIQDLSLRSPFAEAHLQGVMDDWRNLKYQMNVTSTVDLTQASDVLQTGTTLRGSGNFVGTVTGNGDQYQVDGSLKSDALAADGVRLQALNISAKGSGQGKSYDFNGRAVAQLLTAGDFQLNAVQITGGVMGTGSDFRWIGELRAAAEKSYGTTISGLILRDARAEYHDGELTASAPQFSADSLTTATAKVQNGIQANDLRVTSKDGKMTATIASAKAGKIQSGGTTINGVTAKSIDIKNDGITTNVTVQQVQVGEANAFGAQTGSINIAGVRLAIHDGRVQGTTSDINAGNVKLKDGSVENVKLARPAFTVEPSGRYRASADLSLGGGVMGQMKLGPVHAAVVATSDQIQVNNFVAEALDGRASGNATISLRKNGASVVNADFNNFDVRGLITLVSKRAFPIASKATGKANLTFTDSDFTNATGNVTAELVAAPGSVADTPLAGEVAVTANHGVFQIQRVNLQTSATTLTASGQFSVEQPVSNLTVNVASTDASELQNLLISSGAFSDLEEQFHTYAIDLGGKLNFNGTLMGAMKDPVVNGHAELGSLSMNQRDLGSLTANISSTATETRVTDGRLTQATGGGAQFSLVVPRNGDNNASVDATLDRMNLGNLIAALPFNKQTRDQMGDTQGDISGTVRITGMPNAMSGVADIRSSQGRLAGEPLQGLTAHATFTGSSVDVDKVDLNFDAGHITASGKFDLKTKAFDLTASGDRVQLARLQEYANLTNLPPIAGIATIKSLHASGVYQLSDLSSYVISFDAESSDVTIKGKPAGAIAIAGRTENKQLNVSLTSSALFGDQPQMITARVDLSQPKLPAVIESTMNGTDITRALRIFVPADVMVNGRATGSLKLSGNLLDEEDNPTIHGLVGKATFSEISINVGEQGQQITLAAAEPVVIEVTPDAIVFHDSHFTGSQTNVTVGGALATNTGGRNTLAVNGQVNLRILSLFSPDLFSSGIATLAVNVGGTFDNQRVTGQASVDRATVSIYLGDQRVMLSNLHGSILFNSQQAQIDRPLEGTIEGGHFSVTGGAQLDGFDVSQFLFNINGTGMTLNYPQDFRSTVDANLEVRGTRKVQFISGDVRVRRAEYTHDIELAELINQRPQQTLEEGSEFTFAQTANFDKLRVEGRNALILHNNIGDVVASLSLQLDGPVKDPIIEGRITATRGTLNFRNTPYEITRGLIYLPPRLDADPILNIEAQSVIRGYRVTAMIEGPLSHPTTSVGAEPSLPQADVVSLILNGTLTSSDTGTSVLAQSGVGTAASLLTDALINAPISRATNKLFGLSRLEINPVISSTNSAPTARLTAARRVTKDMTITYSTNIASDPNQVLSVEYRVSNRMSFVAQYEQGSNRNLATRNNNYSFEIRFRKRF